MRRTAPLPKDPSRAAAPRAPKVADLAKAAGVSPGLVYSFLSGKFYGTGHTRGVGISEETQVKIIDVCRQLGYRPDNPELATRIFPETGDFVFLLSGQVADGIANAYFSLMLAGAVDRLTPSGRQIGFAQFDPAADYLANPERLPDIVRTGRANRFLLAGSINYSLVNALVRKGHAVVYLSRFVDLPGVISIVPDYAGAAAAGIRHLLELGHRHIGVVAEQYFHPDAFNTRELIRGVQSAMAEAGIAFAPEDVVYKQVAGPEVRSSVLPKFLARRPRPSALFCFDDWTAKCMLQAAWDAGLNVPSQLSIVGCNDDRTAAYTSPPLTTVHVPAFEMGQRAIAEVEKTDWCDRRSEARCVVIPTKLVVRASAAAAKR